MNEWTSPDARRLTIEEARQAYGVRMQAIDAMEGKLGVILGFSAAVVTLAASIDTDRGWLLALLVLAGVVAALLALLGLWPRSVPVMTVDDLGQFHEDSLDIAESELIGWYSQSFGKLDQSTQGTKLRLLRSSGVALVVATFLAATAAVID